MQTEKIQAVQGVVDRVGSYQEGAPERTVEQELRDGLTEAGLELTDQPSRLVDDGEREVLRRDETTAVGVEQHIL